MRHLALLAGVLLASGIWAQEEVRFQYSFDGGLNLRDDGSTISQSANYFVGHSFNFDVFPNGTITKRTGIDFVTETSLPLGLRLFDGGETYLDEAGVYQSSSLISDMLRTAVSDSCYAGYLDSIRVALYDQKYYIPVVRNIVSTEATGIVWVFDKRYGVWTKYTGLGNTAAYTDADSCYLKPHSWAMWVPTGDNRKRLFFDMWTDYTKIFQFKPTRTYDEDSTGAVRSIGAQVLTPRFGVPGSRTTFSHAYLTIDTNDSIRVMAVISTIGNTGRQSETEKVALVLSPTSGDSTTTNSSRMYRVPIDEDECSSVQLKIQVIGVPGNRSVSRTRIFPGVIVGRKRAM